MNDLIDRQAAIDAVKKNTFRLTFAEEQNCEGHVAWSANAVYSDVIEGTLLELPSAQPERPKGEWIPQDHNKSNGFATTLVYYFPKCSECGHSGDSAFAFCPWCGADMRG